MKHTPLPTSQGDKSTWGPYGLNAGFKGTRKLETASFGPKREFVPGESMPCLTERFYKF